MIKRNQLIERDYNRMYAPGIKKSYLLTQLSEKYNLSSTAIDRILKLKTNADESLQNLNKKSDATN